MAGEHKGEAHEDALVKRVADAVAGLAVRFGAQGLAPEVAAEGALKGAVVLLLQCGATLGEAADVIEDFADALRADAPGANIGPTVQ